jgi:hypothetical protein
VDIPWLWIGASLVTLAIGIAVGRFTKREDGASQPREDGASQPRQTLQTAQETLWRLEVAETTDQLLEFANLIYAWSVRSWPLIEEAATKARARPDLSQRLMAGAALIQVLTEDCQVVLERGPGNTTATEAVELRGRLQRLAQRLRREQELRIMNGGPPAELSQEDLARLRYVTDRMNACLDRLGITPTSNEAPL